MESIGLRSANDYEWDQSGYRDPTPQFHVLMRQNSRRCCSKKACCIAIVLSSLLGILIAGAMIYIYVLNDPLMLFGALNNSTLIPGNVIITPVTLTSVTNHPVAVTKPANSTEWNTECPTITGVGSHDVVTALFGGENANGQPVTSIDVIPKRKCSSLPRFRF